MKLRLDHVLDPLLDVLVEAEALPLLGLERLQLGVDVERPVPRSGASSSLRVVVTVVWLLMVFSVSSFTQRRWLQRWRSSRGAERSSRPWSSSRACTIALRRGLGLHRAAGVRHVGAASFARSSSICATSAGSCTRASLELLRLELEELEALLVDRVLELVLLACSRPRGAPRGA